MRVSLKRLFCGLLASLALLGVFAMPVAAATKLPVKAAGDKAQLYAKHTCGHDPYCVKHGITDCRRLSSHGVECRMYIKRATPVQGRYQCQKEVRVVLEPPTDKVVVAGAVGNTTRWSCRR